MMTRDDIAQIARYYSDAIDEEFYDYDQPLTEEQWQKINTALCNLLDAIAFEEPHDDYDPF